MGYLFLKQHLITQFNFKSYIMEKTQVLFDEIELLNQQIKELEAERLKLQARRQHFEDYVERLVSQAEDQMNEGGY
jgi:predicted nuclease with TOPRIM domain